MGPRLRHALLLVLAVPLLALHCDLRPGVAVLSPATGAVLLAPDVEVYLLFHPRLLPGERPSVDLEAGLDAPEGPEHRDLSADLVLGRRGRLGVLRVGDLPPGRSRLRIQRGLPRSDRAGPRARWRAPPPLVHVLDRGGFFPDAEGPFAAGVRSASVERLLPSGEVRILDVFVWFPTADGRAPDPTLQAVPGAALAAGAAALPALVFSHGNCGQPTNYAILLATLARAGWLAAAPTHPGNTSDDPDCDTIAAQFRSLSDRPADLIAVVDWLLAESAAPGSPFADAVDPGRLAVAGHSFGALTALATVSLEPRAGSALLLAPVFGPLAPFLMGILPAPVPAMLQVGENDATTPPATDAQPLYEHLVAPRFLVELAGAGHPVFEDRCATALPGVCPADAHTLVARYALGFLGRHAAGDLRWSALLTPVPGATLAADP